MLSLHQRLLLSELFHTLNIWQPLDCLYDQISIKIFCHCAQGE